MLILLTVLLVLAVLTALATRCRRGSKTMDDLRGFRYAHRGLFEKGIPENSLAAFRAAKEAGYGVELDVHLLADGSLAVFHDDTLIRMTGREGKVESLTAGELTHYSLDGTDQTIPLFSQVLEVFDGQVPLIVELKAVGGNQSALCEATCRALEGYGAPYCLESFDPRCIQWLKKHRPGLIRGQLARNYFRDHRTQLPGILKFLLTYQLVNFMTLPDFTAYRFQDRKNPGTFLARRLWGAQGVTWTVRTPEDLQTAEKEGWTVIFEGFHP